MATSGGNSNNETPNPKEIPIPNPQYPNQWAEGLGIGILAFEFPWDLVFRHWGFITSRRLPSTR
jgi:hypothetical protein